MSTRRSVLLAGGAGVLVAHRLSYGQPAATIRRVGFLAFSSEATNAHLRTAFKQGMHDLGWLEGKNVEYRFAYANGDVDRLAALASELIGQRVDVILVGSSQSADAAHRATKTPPIVLAGGGGWGTPGAGGLSQVWPGRGVISPDSPASRTRCWAN